MMYGYACLVLFACYLLLFWPALAKQLKLPVAVSGVIFFESMKIERLFQFTLMTCYLPYIYQNHSKNEPKKLSIRNKYKYKKLSITNFL